MANGKPESRLVKAAGAVAWRPGPDGRPEILLVHRRKYDDWSLPKGKVEPGETLPVTAVREVLEEGGARLALGRRLNSIRYNVGGRPKRVHYWSASVASLDDRAVPNDEVDEIEWVDADRASERLSYGRDNTVIADFARLPARTVPVILLRHAKAMGKSSWRRSDDRRPLDDAGRADAKALAELLACFGSRARLITSPAARCVETLRPFAELSGTELREEPSLYIHTQSSRTDPADSPPSIAALMAQAVAAGEPTIFCAHRENIPVLQAAALAVLGLEGFPGLPKEWDDPLPTSGFWVLNLTLPPPPAPPASPPPPASPTPASPTSPAPRPPAWRRWFRSRARTGAHTRRPGTPATPPTAATPPATPPGLLAAPVPAPETTASEAPAANAAAVTREPSAPPGPSAPRLISADRYDLTEP
jgi:8-oxo-(d)GTP phosphatase